MSWQKRSVQLIIGLPLSMPIATYAINIGDTYVQSQQNQPLNASINVSDIDPATFSVKLAGGSVYQQLGLAREDSVSVRFEPTSSDGGKIVITSSKPLNTPFTDVVLDVNNKGETQTLPKTLLLPIDDNRQVVTQSNTSLVQLDPPNVTIGTSSPVNLPAVTDNTPVTTVSPVETVTDEPIIATAEQPNLPIGTSSPKTTTSTHDNLIISETRRVFPVGSQPNVTVDNTTPTTLDKPVTATPQPTKDDNVTAETTEPTTAEEANQESSEETVTYVIQRNDNLWTIANQLAKQNKTNVNKVMKDIVATNPNAFENGNPSKLIVNSELQVPKYQVMPSQLGVKSAEKIREKTKTTAKTTDKKATTRTTVKAKTTTVAKKPAVKTTRSTTVKTARPITTRKTEMKIIAPTKRGGVSQGTTQTAKNTGSNTASQIVTQVQQKRQVTAKQASKVGQLNQNLVNAEKRLKLQNQKLAQLEERLKELNKK